MAIRYKARLAGNAWSDTIANLLNKYEHGENLTPQVKLDNTIKLPPVKIEMTPETKRLVRFVGVALAAAIAFEGYTRLTNKN